MNRSTPKYPISADRLTAAFHEVGGSARPDYLDDIVQRAQGTPQRPAWTFHERWLPMSVAVRRQGVPRAAVLFALVLLLLALAGVAVSQVGTPPAVPAPLVVTNGLIAYARGSDIVAVQPGETDVVTLATGSGDQTTMRFSPDGRRIAYWSSPGALIVASVDGSDPVTIATTGGERPSWSPDGTKIVYSTPDGRLFIAPVDGSGAVEIGDPELLARPPAWSPDGTTIAFGAAETTEPTIYRLYLMDADGTDRRQVSEVRGNSWAFIRVDWSHDSSKVVAQASDQEDLEEWDIWIIPVDGSAPTDVGAHVGGDEQIPDWAPDRDALAWAHSTATSPNNTTVLLEPGSEPVDLPGTAGTRFSPDGRSLINDGDVDGVVVTDLLGTVQYTIPDATEVFDWQPLFGPGG